MLPVRRNLKKALDRELETESEYKSSPSPLPPPPPPYDMLRQQQQQQPQQQGAPSQVPALLSLSLDDSRTTQCECLGRTRWSSPLDWTTYLYYFYRWLYTTSP